MIYIYIYIIIIYRFIIFYIFIGIQAFTLFNTSSSIFHSLSQPSFYNIVHIPTVTITFLKYINILYLTLFKLLIIQQAYNDSSVIRYLKSGINSIKNFVLTSLSLYITLINITLIIVTNCSMLNPGPVNPNALSVFYQNIQGFITFSSLASNQPSLSINKILELNSYIASNHPDIVVLNETWLKESVKNSEFFPDNDYKVFRLDRSVNTHSPDPSDTKKFRRNGGGVLIAIKSTVDMNPKLVKSKAHAEILSVTLTLKNNKKLCITTCYRVGTLQQTNLEEVNKHLQSISSNKSIIKHIVLGDFNLDSVKWDNNNINTSNNLHLRYTNVFEDHCLSKLLKSPTHYKGNILDLVLTDEPNIVKDIYIAQHNEYIKSDHFFIKFSINIKGAIKRAKAPKRSIRNYKKANWARIDYELRNVNWAHHIDCTDINTAWLNFKSILNSICDAHIPKVTIKNKLSYPWYDAEVHKLNRKKEKFRSQYKTSQNVSHYSKYSQTR